ncbi:MAG: NUDIX domain-containing protein [Patescibacteria group bacterium]|nr:NUDIX domain-containing protein [Patescibacteria group bacterium]MDD5490886.1 NUDIX domain-containing protein [Patescibacteria group bacterium]
MDNQPSVIKKYILESLEQLEPVDEQEIQDKKKIKNFLVLHPQNFYDIENYKGHVTVSGVIVCRDQLLLFKKNKSSPWGQLHNHCEEGEFPFATIKKILEEKTGITDLKPRFIDEEERPLPYQCEVYDIDVTPDIKTDPNHTHFDLLYLFDIKDKKAETELSGEAKWFPKNEAAKLNKRLRKVIMKLMGKIIM